MPALLSKINECIQWFEQRLPDWNTNASAICAVLTELVAPHRRWHSPFLARSYSPKPRRQCISVKQ